MKKILYLSVLLFVAIVLPRVLHAGNNDTVKTVFSCNDDIGIEMQNAGWVVAVNSEIGEKRVDRILSIALSLLATGKPTGYFNEGQPFELWCGITTAKPITVLGIRSGQ